MTLLNHHQAVGIIALSNGLSENQRQTIEQLEVVLTNLGLEVKYPTSLFRTNSVYHATDQERAQMLMDFYQDNHIQAIFDVSGGDLANGVLPYLDYDLIHSHSKLFFGYSDLSVVLNAIYAKNGQRHSTGESESRVQQVSDHTAHNAAALKDGTRAVEVAHVKGFGQGGVGGANTHVDDRRDHDHDEHRQNQLDGHQPLLAVAPPENGQIDKDQGNQVGRPAKASEEALTEVVAHVAHEVILGLRGSADGVQKKQHREDQGKPSEYVGQELLGEGASLPHLGGLLAVVRLFGGGLLGGSGGLHHRVFRRGRTLFYGFFRGGLRRLLGGGFGSGGSGDGGACPTALLARSGLFGGGRGLGVLGFGHV